MALWTPAQIATEGWWDFADESTLWDSVSGGSTPDFGESVLRVDDKSGNGNDATQATFPPTRRQSVVNGRNAVETNGVNQYLEFTTPANLRANAAKTIIFVYQGTGNGFYDFALSTRTVIVTEGYLLANDSRTVYNHTGEGDTIVAGAVANRSIAHLGGYTTGTNGANVTHYLDGSSLTLTTNTISTARVSSNPTRIGCQASAYSGGYLCELIMLAGIITATDRQKLEGYLAHKWGTESLLPADHPYKTYAPGDLSTGLQGWWCPSRDTAGNGTTTLTDLSGNGNNGTLTNMDAATDWVADTDSGGVRALDLDGSNDAVSLPTIPVASLQTVSVWVKFAALPASLTLAFSSRNPMRLYLGQANGTGYIRVGSDSGSLGGSVSLSTTEWFHLVAVAADDGLSYTGYINGVNVGGRATTLSATTAVGLGAYFITPTLPVSSYLSGLLDSVAVYSRALTADEVTQLYNGGRSLNLLASGTIYSPLGNGRLLNPLNRGRIR